MTQPAPTLNPEEIEFAKAFFGRRSDREIAKMMKRSLGLIGDLRRSLKIPRGKTGPRGILPKDGKLLLCYRCGVVKFVTRVKADGEPAETVCRWCREEIEAGQSEYRHRWTV